MKTVWTLDMPMVSLQGPLAILLSQVNLKVHIIPLLDPALLFKLFENYFRRSVDKHLRVEKCFQKKDKAFIVVLRR